CCVMLAPYSHHDKTPPCSEALITYGVAHVAISVPDPDPHVSSRVPAILREPDVRMDAGMPDAAGRHSLAASLPRPTKTRPSTT
ncbi:riboflavin biosynthesis protein RibD, partial [Rhizobium johnstonii]